MSVAWPLAIALALVVLAPAVARAQVDLLSQANIQLDGAAVNDQAGSSVADAGDVNGDGRADVIVGAPGAGNNGRFLSGSAYVLFGTAASTTVDLAALGGGGFRIDGAAAVDLAGTSVGGAGDVNDDGLADVIVGAPRADNNGRTFSGSAYVVFGKATSAGVDLAALGAGGFRIDGAAAFDLAGVSVDGAGDVNGDGLTDVIVGAGVANRGGIDSGAAYVVFGKTTSANVDLAALGAGGFRIDGAATNDRAGTSVAGAGDVNGDGRPDVIVGAPLAENNGRNASGSAYVVFGKTTSAAVDLAALGADGFRIDGADAFDEAGLSVAGAGDANADGRADVVVGAPFADNNGRTDSGSAYVVFGQATSADVDLAALGADGFRIGGAAAGDFAGFGVAGGGDVNADGRADVVVGAPFADNNGRIDSGSAYVVFGQATSAGIDLAALGVRGFRVEGATASDEAGTSVAGGGDVNADGRPDVIVGAPLADNNGRTTSGSAYVVFGSGQSLPALVFQSTLWLLRDTLSGGPPTSSYSYGARPLAPVMGDWDGDGSRTPGTFEGGLFKLRNANSAGAPDITFTFGDPRGFAVAGDFDGDGRDDVAVYRNGLWQVRLIATGTTRSFTYGTGSWPATVAVSGDWDRDGTDGIGTYDLASASWDLRNSPDAGPADAGSFVFGTPGQTYPVPGDWNADGIDSPGVKLISDFGLWSVRNQASAGPADHTFAYGSATTLPLTWRR